jgi:hypothetical protein
MIGNVSWILQINIFSRKGSFLTICYPACGMMMRISGKDRFPKRQEEFVQNPDEYTQTDKISSTIKKGFRTA